MPGGDSAPWGRFFLNCFLFVYMLQGCVTYPCNMIVFMNMLHGHVHVMNILHGHVHVMNMS